MDTNANHIERAVSIFGSQKKLADAMSCSQQHVSLLIRGAVRVTAEMALAVDKATDGVVSKHDLRPDIFGEPATEAAQ